MTDDEMVAEYDVRSPAQRTLMTVVATLVVAGLAIGSLLAVSKIMTNTRVENASVDASKFSQVILKAGAADIKVEEGASGEELTFSATITSGLRSTHYELLRNGDEIVIDSACRTWVSPGCGVELTVGVPSGMSMLIESTSGDIDVDGGVSGVLTVLSGSGDVDVDRLVVDECSVTTGSGDVEVRFDAAPFGVKVGTGSGDIEVAIPDDERTFSIDLRSASGDVDSQLSTDPQGEGFIRLSSTSGDIELDVR